MEMTRPRKLQHRPAFWVGVVLLGVALLLVSSRVQAAQPATQTITRTSLRAGPFPDFPVVAAVPPRQWVQLHGCLPDWSWCQAQWGTVVGWCLGAEIGVDRQGWVYTERGVYWLNRPALMPTYVYRFQPGVHAPGMSQSQPFFLRPTSPNNLPDPIDRTPRLPQPLPLDRSW